MPGDPTPEDKQVNRADSVTNARTTASVSAVFVFHTSMVLWERRRGVRSVFKTPCTAQEDGSPTCPCSAFDVKVDDAERRKRCPGWQVQVTEDPSTPGSATITSVEYISAVKRPRLLREQFALAHFFLINSIVLANAELQDLPSDLLDDAFTISALSLGNNLIDRVPEFVGKLQSLQSLSLTRNKITSVDAASFARNRGLQSIDLSRNKIDAIGAATFANLPRLTQLSLFGNELASVPRDMLAMPGASARQVMQIIDLGYNRLRMIPSDFLTDVVGTLQKLVLVGNDVADFNFLASSGTQVQALSVSKLGTVPTAFLQSLAQSVQELEMWLDTTGLGALNREHFRGVRLRALRLLNADTGIVRQNSLAAQDSMTGASAMVLTLSDIIRNPALRGESTPLVAEEFDLTLLPNYGTQMFAPMVLPGDMFSLMSRNPSFGRRVSGSYLESLSIRGLGLATWSGSLNRDLTFLRHLDLSFNLIRNVGENDFRGLFFLSTLSLANNMLDASSVSANFTLFLCEVQRIDFSSNRFDMLTPAMLAEVAKPPTRVTQFSLQNNPFRCFPEWLPALAEESDDVVTFIPSSSGLSDGGAANVCVFCEAGQRVENFVDGCITCREGEFCGENTMPWDAENVLCPAGRWSNPGTTRKEDCFSCPPGYQCPGNGTRVRCPIGKASCDDCAPGRYSNPDETDRFTCLPCPSGRFGDSPRLSNENCTGECPPGSFCLGETSNPLLTLCPPGRFGSMPGEVLPQCEGDCQPGYSDRNGTQTDACVGPCLPFFTCFDGCAPGQYSANDPAQCDPCGGLRSWPDFALPTTIRDRSIGVDKCSQTCPPGTYNVTRALRDPCEKCPLGRFSAATGATEASTCQECPVNTYAAIPGSATCTTCPAGRFFPFTGGSSPNLCGTCPPGSFLDPLRISQGVEPRCILCPAGFYSDTEGASQCTPCRSGRYSGLEGSTRPCMQRCEDGWFCPQGSTSPRQRRLPQGNTLQLYYRDFAVVLAIIASLAVFQLTLK
ncbi:MAG: hypothetical protein MHM6MM_002999 [Cercozoa sp. M6MM]